MATMLRQTQLVVEVLVENTPKLRSTQEVVESLLNNTPAARIYQNVVEAVLGGETTAPVRAYQVVLEVLLEEGSGSSYDNSLTIAGNSAVTLLPGTGWFDSLTIAGNSDTAEFPGLAYFSDLTITGNAATEQVSAYGVGASLTIAGNAAITQISGYEMALTVTASAAVTSSASIGVFFSHTIAGVANFFSPGGIALFNTLSIDGVSDIAKLAGFGYFETKSIDGVSDIAQVEQRVQNDFLTIAGNSATDTASQYVVNAPLTIVGIASYAYTDLIDMVLSRSIAGIAFIGVENLYEVLYDVNCFAQVTVVGDAFKNNNQQPAAQGSISVACTGTFNRTVTQGILFDQFATYKRTTGIANQTFTMSQTVTCQRIHLETVSQTLAMTQDAHAARGIVQTLVFGQTATCVKVIARTVTQTLTMTDAATRTTVINRTLSDTLVFNIPVQTAAPIIGSQGGGDQTQFQYNQPLVSVALKPRNCLVILGSPTQTVILPCPIFGDTQAYTGEINLKKTMTGDTYTYVKKTSTERLKYTFNIGTYKSIELRNFLIGHSHELITMHNWKGETWYVFVVNNPFDFTHEGRWQPKGERVTITLEFEGIRKQ